MQIYNEIKINTIPFKQRKSDSVNDIQNTSSTIKDEYRPVPTELAKAYASPQIINNYKEIQAFKLPFIGEGKLYELKNGHKVIIIPKKNDRTTFTTVVNVGFANEPADKKGIAHLLEHLLMNYSYYPNEITKDILESLNADINANTSGAFTSYQLEAHVNTPKDLVKLAEIQYNNLTNTFSQKDMEREKKLLINESKETGLFNNSDFIADDKVIQNLFHLDSSDGMIADHSEAKINNIVLDDLHRFYKEYYKPQNMTSIIIGNVDDSTIKIIANKFVKAQKCYSSIDKTTSHKINLSNQFSRVDINDNAPVSTAIMAFAGVEAAGDKISDMEILTILLQQKLRRKGVNANIDFQVISNDKQIPQIIKIKIKNNTNDIENNINSVKDVIQELKDGKVSEKELENAKEFFINNSCKSLENNKKLTWFIMEHFFNNNLDNILALDQIQQISVKDIQDNAVKYLDIDKASLVVTHPQDSFNNVSFKGMPNYIQEYSLPNNLHVIVDTKPGTMTSTVSCELLFENKNKNSKGIIKALENSIESIDSSESLDNNWINYNGVFVRKSGAATQLNEIIQNIKQIIIEPTFNEQKFQNEKIIQHSNNFNKEITRDKLLLDNDYTPESNQDLCPFNMTSNELRHYYNNLLKTAQGYIVITTPKEIFDNNKQSILETLSSVPKLQPLDFNKINIYNTPKQLNKNFVFINSQTNSEEVSIDKEYKIITNKNVEIEAATMLLNDLINKRINEKFRKKDGLSYYPYSQTAKPSANHLILSINIPTAQEPLGANLEYILLELDNIIKDITTNLLNDKDLDIQKTKTISSLLDSSETSYERNIGLISNYRKTFDINYNNKIITAIQEITPKKLLEIAQTILNQPSILTISGNTNAINKNINYLRSFDDKYC